MTVGRSVNLQQAKEVDKHSAVASTEQYLTFMLEGEEYGVQILDVQEIKGWDSCTEIPNTPDHVLGVINLRGAVIPVIDLRRRFALPPREFTPLTVVIVLRAPCEGEVKTIGLVVDAVSDVYDVATDDIKPAPDFGTVVEQQYVEGLATVGEKMIILLNIEHVVSYSR